MKSKAEITAFLSLTFILIVTFIGSVMEAAAVQVEKNYKKTAALHAMECVFAEYQKELLEEYDVFSLEAGYESGNYSENFINKRLEYYGFVNSSNTIERIKFLSDGKGEGFYEQVNYYMEHKYGLDFVKDELGMTTEWKKQEDAFEYYEKLESKNENLLEDLFEGSENELPSEGNPISYIDGLKKLSVLKLVMPEGKTVSEKTLSLGELSSRRTLNQGYGDFSEEEQSYGTVNKLLFGEYLLEHFYSAVDNSEHVLKYEIEYLIGGRKSDRENLKEVVNHLIAIRFVPNYAYLKGNAEKRAQAKTLALTLCTVAAASAATEAVTQGILLAWAFGESVVDVRTLLNGNKVPLTKSDKTWQLSLSGLLKLGEKGRIGDGANVKNGMNYEDYLKILLFLEKKEALSMRALDLIEVNLQKIQGLEFFKVDYCATKLEIQSRCSLRRGVTYTFPVYFAYQ